MIAMDMPTSLVNMGSRGSLHNARIHTCAGRRVSKHVLMYVLICDVHTETEMICFLRHMLNTPIFGLLRYGKDKKKHNRYCSTPFVLDDRQVSVSNHTLQRIVTFTILLYLTTYRMRSTMM